MPFALWSILIAAVLPLVWTVIAKAGAPYNNHCPRQVLEAATGYRQRANWAQQNAWEAFAPYAAAMIIAWQMHVPLEQLNGVAAIFIAARVVHGILYLSDQATWRSLVWFVGLGSVVYLFVLAASSGVK